MASGRPHVNAALRAEPAAPLAGQPLTLTLDLSDGSTGLPVDDLVPHHEALIASGGDRRRSAPSSRICTRRASRPAALPSSLTPDRPGRYTAYIEVERQDSGVQVIARDFEVGGASASPRRQSAWPGRARYRRSTGECRFVAHAAARRPPGDADVQFQPPTVRRLTDMQPWLGMAGHLIARSADGMIFRHIHAAERWRRRSSSLDVGHALWPRYPLSPTPSRSRAATSSGASSSAPARSSPCR